MTHRLSASGYGIPSRALLWKSVFLNKGATQQEKDLQKQQAAFYSTLTADYNQQFAKQGAIIDSLNKVWGPIFQAGPNQYGFSTAEDTTLHTQAKEGTANDYQQAQV